MDFKEKKKINLNYIFFFIAYIFSIAFWMFSNVVIVKDIRPFFMNITFTVLLIQFINQSKKYKVKSIGYVLLIFGFSILSWKKSGSNEVLILILFLICSKNIKFNTIVKVDLIIKILFFAIIIVCYKLGFTNVYYMYRENGLIRSSMGFSHPNMFGLYVFSICCDLFYVIQNKKRLLMYFIFCIAIVIVLHFSDSRATCVVIILLMIGSAICNRNNLMENKIVKKTLQYFFVVCALFSILMAIFYSENSTFFRRMDELFNTRISSANTFLKEYDINLLGNQLELIGTKQAKILKVESKILDNAYVKLLLQYGIIIFCTYFVMFKKIINRAYKEKNYKIIIILTVMMLYGISENALFKKSPNIFLLYFSNVIFLKEGERIENVEKEKSNT